MKIINLCDDILESIELEVKRNPKYIYKKVLQELVQEDWILRDRGIDELLGWGEPILYAHYYSWENGGWYLDTIDGTSSGRNWVVEEYWGESY